MDAATLARIAADRARDSIPGPCPRCGSFATTAALYPALPGAVQTARVQCHTCGAHTSNTTNAGPRAALAHALAQWAEIRARTRDPAPRAPAPSLAPALHP